MSAPVIGGLVLAGLAIAMLLAMAISAVPDSGSARARRARRAARYYDLPLAPELVDWLSDRQRVRQLTALLVLGPVLPPLAFWYGNAWSGAIARGLQFPQPAAMSIRIVVPVVTLVAFARRYGELRWARAHGWPLLSGDRSRGLAASVPPAMTWLVGAVVVILAAAAAAVGIAGSRGSPGRLWLRVHVVVALGQRLPRLAGR